MTFPHPHIIITGLPIIILIPLLACIPSFHPHPHWLSQGFLFLLLIILSPMIYLIQSTPHFRATGLRPVHRIRIQIHSTVPPNWIRDLRCDYLFHTLTHLPQALSGNHFHLQTISLTLKVSSGMGTSPSLDEDDELGVGLDLYREPRPLVFDDYLVDDSGSIHPPLHRILGDDECQTRGQYKTINQALQ
ncbi:hypothetical protein C8R41DRAFT_845908 [Lentinula lateritia]|uniref:Uncharacterized protein n=1 Tax=Lentinula lateritia TaxID=40482 RepID=A0ABQ8V6C1_9AGAR|nr:hypothetical protein C8R41DRAFT_845908 [Lentinula lateritia]